jgi:hypothetical protein
MTKKITFFPLYDNIQEIAKPQPAKNCIPDWYKEQSSYLNKTKNFETDTRTEATIKKCIPFFDFMTSGYIMFTSIDILISSDEENNVFYSWPHSFTNKLGTTKIGAPVEFHSKSQVSNYSKLNKDSVIPKFINPWTIQTPKGYSVLIITPGQRDLPFEIIPAIVDTDKYNWEINFPFYIKTPGWKGIIEAGTPIAQIIPFKRDAWKMDINNTKKKKTLTQKQGTVLQSSFYNQYKNSFWNKKDFK